MGKPLSALSLKDFKKTLFKAGITGSVQASQTIEAVQKFLESEFPQLPITEVYPQSIKHDVLIIKVSHPTQAQVLRDFEEQIKEYVRITCNTDVQRIQFSIHSN